jgi:long-chain acyl-CoA synthetase
MNKPWLKSYDNGMPPTLNYPACSLSSLLHDSAKEFPERTALVFFGHEITYLELASFVNSFASALLRLGVQPGDRVALLLPNSPQFVISYYGAMQAGAIVVPINPLYVAREISHILSDSGATIMVCLEEISETIFSLLPQTQVRTAILTQLKEYLPFFKGLTYTLLKQKRGEKTNQASAHTVKTYSFKELISTTTASPHDYESPSCEDIALLQYTGGLTAPLTNRNLVANTLQSRSLVHFHKEGKEIYLSVLPYFYGYGMNQCYCYFFIIHLTNRHLIIWQEMEYQN